MLQYYEESRKVLMEQPDAAATVTVHGQQGVAASVTVSRQEGAALETAKTIEMSEALQHTPAAAAHVIGANA